MPLLLLITSLLKFTDNSFIFFWAPFLKELNFTGTQIGVLMAMFSITGLVTILPAGFFNDRISSKYLISSGFIFLALYFLGASQEPSFTSFLLIFFAGGVGLRIVNISLDSLILKLTKKAHKISWYLSALFFPGAIGMILGGFLITKLSFETTLLIGGYLYISLIFLSLLLPKTETTKFKLLNYREDILNKEMLVFLGLFFLLALHFGAENTSYGLFLRENLNLSFLESGIYMGTAVLIMGFTSLILGKYLNKNKITLKKIILWGLFLSGIGHILMTIPSLYPSIFFRIIHEIGDAFIFTFELNALARMFKSKRIGGNRSIVTLTVIISVTLASLVFGPLGETFGYQWPLIISGFSVLIALAVGKKYHHLILE